MLSQQADVTCSEEAEDIVDPFSVLRFVDAFQALEVLLGELLLICSKSCEPQMLPKSPCGAAELSCA